VTVNGQFIDKFLGITKKLDWTCNVNFIRVTSEGLMIE